MNRQAYLPQGRNKSAKYQQTHVRPVANLQRNGGPASVEAMSRSSGRAQPTRQMRRNIPTPATRGHNQPQESRVPAPRRHRRFATTFCTTLRRTPPPIPPSLLRFGSELDVDKNSSAQAGGVNKKKDNIGLGRVKVLLRVCPQHIVRNDEQASSRQSPQASESILRVEGNRKHVTIFDSESGLQSAQMRVGVSAPKVYGFDAVFPEDISQAEVCSTSLVDVIQAVVQGADGAVFCYGHSGLGKTYTLLGLDSSAHDLGLIPCAISWLYRAIEETRDKTKGRFSVRVSAIEVHGRTEQLKDLLKDFSKDDGPTDELCVREDPLFGTQLQNQCELRASTVEKAAHMLDAALASRSSSGPNSTEEARRHSHMVYTLHVYQYRVDKSGKAGVTGGRSRLHFIDLGSCDKTLMKTPNSLTLSLNSLGHVIMAIINNSKHVPFKESKLTLVLQELLGNFNCRTVMLAHVSRVSSHYAETLATVQMASRIHRVLLKKKNKSSASAGALRGVGGHFSKVKSHRGKSGDEESLGTSSGVGETSGSEVSCDTVIYVRPNGVPFSDRELTDNEGPPVSVPIRPPPQSPLTDIAELEQGRHQNHAPPGPRNEKYPGGSVERGTPTQRGKALVTAPPSARPRQCREVVSPRKTPDQQQHKKLDTRSKLASHAKYVNSLQQSDNKKSKLARPTEIPHGLSSKARRQTFDASSNRKKPEVPQDRKHLQSFTAPSKMEKYSVSKQQKASKLRPPGNHTPKKSRIPPPPPPRDFSRIGVQQNPAIPKPTQSSSPRCRRKMDFRVQDPTFGTLHANHMAWEAEDNQRSLATASEDDDRPSTSLTNENASHDNQDVAQPEYSNYELEVQDFQDHDSIENVDDSREEPDGRTAERQQPAKTPRATSVQNRTGPPGTSGRKKRTDAEKSEIERCMRDLEDVINKVEQNDARAQSESIGPNAKMVTRPDSMVVNVNDDEWNSDDDEITNNSDEMSEGEDDVVDVNFYCLSFTTKNPLIPLSKRSFVHQVSKRRRQSRGEMYSGLELANDDQDASNHDEVIKSSPCNEENAMAADTITERNGMRRSGTFVVECSTSPNLPEIEAIEDMDTAQKAEAALSPNDNSLSCDNSTISSPSQVLLYDSSSLEINYIKPKSLSFHRMRPPPQNTSSSSPTESPPKRTLSRQKAIGDPDGTNTTERHTKSPPAAEDGPFNTAQRKVLVAGMGGKHGAQLSLVKSDGAKSTLELVITANEGSDQENFAVPTTLKKSSKNAQSKKSAPSNKNLLQSESPKSSSEKSTPQKKSRWRGLRRFGSRRDNEREKTPEKAENEKSAPKALTKRKSPKKQENATVRDVKSNSSSSPSFVTKLLSPKSRRGRKSSISSSISSEFRYRGPTTAVSQMRPDIVRATAPLVTDTATSDIANNRVPEDNIVPQSSEQQATKIATATSGADDRLDAKNPAKRVASQPTRTRFGFGRKSNKS